MIGYGIPEKSSKYYQEEDLGLALLDSEDTIYKIVSLDMMECYKIDREFTKEELELINCLGKEIDESYLNTFSDQNAEICWMTEEYADQLLLIYRSGEWQNSNLIRFSFKYKYYPNGDYDINPSTRNFITLVGTPEIDFLNNEDFDNIQAHGKTWYDFYNFYIEVITKEIEGKRVDYLKLTDPNEEDDSNENLNLLFGGNNND